MCFPTWLVTKPGSKHEGLQHPPPPSQPWNKDLNETEAFFSSNCIITVLSCNILRKFRCISSKSSETATFFVFACTICNQNGRFPSAVDNYGNIFWATSKNCLILRFLAFSLLPLPPSPPPIQNWNLLRTFLPSNDPWLCSNISKLMIAHFISPM